jgi:WS/DGAT/MGAT family acyltransferase
VQQLSGLDASFVYSETASTPNHIAGLYVYDPSGVPGGVTFESILANIEERLRLARSFRQRLVRVPFDLDHPYWVEDEAFDLEFHVRQLALPRPGDWRQLCAQTARLHARPLDLTRPPWEITVIEGVDAVEGLPPGCFALLWKTHHAAIDGMSGVEILNAVHDTEPEGVQVEGEDPWRPEPVPGVVGLLARATVRNALNPFKASRVVGRAAPALRPLLGQLRRGEVKLPQRVPPTRFNAPVTPHRVFDGRIVPLAEMKRVRKAVPGATVNDAVLTVVGGALRHYLGDKGELPADPLVTMVPVSIRSADAKAAAGNQVTIMPASLATDVADPVARLAAVHASTASSKQLTQAIDARTLTEASELLPGMLIGLDTRAAARMANRMPFNTTITNVPGSPVPLYFCGALMKRSYGLGPVVHGGGLFHTVGSYEQDFMIAFTACRELLPDPATYADCIQTSIDELSAAVP